MQHLIHLDFRQRRGGAWRPGDRGGCGTIVPCIVNGYVQVAVLKLTHCLRILGGAVPKGNRLADTLAPWSQWWLLWRCSAIALARGLQLLRCSLD